MKNYLPFVISLIFFACSDDEIAKKGFQVSEQSEETGLQNAENRDTFGFHTKPRNVLLTYDKRHRLTPVYKVNYHKKTKRPWVGSNRFHHTYSDHSERPGNNWNGNFMPGFEAVYGYNFVNISHYNNETKTESTFFPEPVLIKTLYYPAWSKDTLNGKPISRDYYMVSVYDEDTNQDGFINIKDLRRLYYFDMDLKNKTALVPENYAVLSSEYDPENDFMYIFAAEDENENGQYEYEESTQIFWLDLKQPQARNGRQYAGE